LRCRPLVIAHRGFSGKYPENTLRSIREALKLPVDGVEVDVRRSLDGVLVLMHDEAVDRTTNGRGLVGRLSWAELRSLDAGSWRGEEFAGEPVPRLDEVLSEVAGRAMLHVEVKELGIESQVLRTVRECGTQESVVIASFFEESIRVVKTLEPASPLTLIAGPREASRWGGARPLVYRAIASGASCLALHYSLVTTELATYAKRRNVALMAWTVNSPNDGKRLAEQRVDALATDHPDEMLRALEPSR
jgi:glycerophosphoryl diester phosphodiesterase